MSTFSTAVLNTSTQKNYSLFAFKNVKKSITWCWIIPRTLCLTKLVGWWHKETSGSRDTLSDWVDSWTELVFNSKSMLVFRKISTTYLTKTVRLSINKGNWTQKLVWQEVAFMFQNGGCEGLTAGAVIKSKSDNIFIVRKQFYYMYFSLLASSTGSSSGTTFLLLGLGLSSFSESILKAAVQHFEVAHAASSCGLSSLCLDAPVN